MNQFIELGEIVTTHGIKGEVRVYPWADSPEFLLQFKEVYLGEERLRLRVMSSAIHKNVARMKFKDFSTIEQAEGLLRKILYIKRDQLMLEVDEFLIADLIGLEVVDVDDGRVYGKLDEVMRTGANDVYVVKNGEKSVLIPAIDTVVIETDLAAGKLQIRPMEGLLDPEEIRGED